MKIKNYLFEYPYETVALLMTLLFLIGYVFSGNFFILCGFCVILFSIVIVNFVKSNIKIDEEMSHRYFRIITDYEDAILYLYNDKNQVLETYKKSFASRENYIKDHQKKFTQKFVRENFDTSYICAAYVFYKISKKDDIKIYLKMKWSFVD